MMLPMFAIPIPFLFVLLILLLVKTPKVGVWVIFGLITAMAFGLFIFLPIAVHDGLLQNVPRGEEAIPFFAIPIPFLFVLLILLLSKAPKVGAAAIVGVVAMGMIGAFLWLSTSRSGASHEQPMEGGVRVRRQREHYGTQSVEEWDQVQENYKRSLTGRGALAEPAVASPIWSEGVENEYEADIYPSKLAAVRALGAPVRQWIQQTVEDFNQPLEVVLFQEHHDSSLFAELQAAIEKAPSDIRCAIELGSRNIGFDEIGVTLRRGAAEPQPTRRPHSATGWVSASARIRDRETTVARDFADKPWVENFAGFANEQPEGQFLVARSWESCTSENEAKTQAIRDACDQVSALVGQKWPTVPGQAPLTVSSTDLLEGGFIADQFVQSFDGLSGRIWRQAILIDTSAEKLGWLGSRMTAEVHVVRTTWARMILSAFGVLVVIVATYLFLNMATRGYYVWSLRIAGTVLAIMGIVSILLVLK